MLSSTPPHHTHTHIPVPAPGSVSIPFLPLSWVARVWCSRQFHHFIPTNWRSGREWRLVYLACRRWNQQWWVFTDGSSSASSLGMRRELSRTHFHMFPVYETKLCNETSEKTVLEAGNNTMDIDCADAFKRTTKGTVSKVHSLDLHILSTVPRWDLESFF